jgi:hypothetical protein
MKDSTEDSTKDYEDYMKETYKSWHELKAEHEKNMTRIDKFVRWWNQDGLIMLIGFCLIGGGLIIIYSAVVINQRTKKCDQHNGIMLSGQCIQSDLIHKINVE